MSNKYYTPTIEEFQEGFAYCPDPQLYKVPKEVPYMHSGVKYNVPRMLEEGRIKVKCLDQEDIESLGFELVDGFYVGKGFVDRKKQWIGHEVRLCIEDGYIELSDGDKHNPYNWFSGTIKNKSELEKVLKMIGYEVY